MLKIFLNNLLFNAYHGLHEEEAFAGNEFLVNVEVWFIPKNNPIVHLEDTLDYGVIYEIIKSFMDRPTPLLETLVMLMAEKLLEKFPQIQKLHISIRKRNAPIIGFNGKAGVAYEWTK